MNPTESPHLHARFKTTKGDLVVVNAWRGTQAVGRITGNPVNDTEYGRVVLTFSEADGHVAALTLDQQDDITSIMGILDRADRVADSRDTAEDKPHPDFPQETT